MFVIISIQEKEMPYLLVAVTDEVLKTQQEGPTRGARLASANIRAEERSDTEERLGHERGHSWWRLKRAGSCPSTELSAQPAVPGPVYQGKKRTRVCIIREEKWEGKRVADGLISRKRYSV